MILGFPLFAWLGVFAFIFLMIQMGLGIAMTKFNKPVMKYHKLFGILTGIFAIAHVCLALLALIKGVYI
jgi:hypothetical protein